MEKPETVNANADDLDDGLIYEVDSEPEDDGFVVREESSEETEVKNAGNPSKRKRKTNDKLKEKKKIKMEQDINKKKEIPLLDSTELSNHFSQLLLKYNKDATHLDYFKKSDFVDASNYKEARILQNFKDFTDKYYKGRTIILSINKVRIGDLFKALGPKSKAIKVGKGYNSTVREDTKYIIGTVERIANMDFSDKDIKVILLDASYQDSKTNSVLDELKLTSVLKTFEGVKTILF